MYILMNSKGLTLAYYTRVIVFLDSVISYSKRNLMLPELYFFLSSGEIMDSVGFDRKEYSVSQWWNFFEPVST